MVKAFFSGAVVIAALIRGLPLAIADCTLTSTDRTPLNDLGPGLYEGFAGGLYPNGTNTRPPAHEAAGLDIALNQILPLDANGSNDVSNGKVVMISIGMSNTTDEFGSDGSFSFMERADADLAKNPRLVIVDGAQGGQDATDWTNVHAATWGTVDSRLAAAGVTSNQVQVAWMKQALAQVANYGAFPAHAQKLQGMLEQIARNTRVRYPNIKLLYISSRTRAYTADPTALNPEPFAYEAGWSTKWAVEDQINGINNLNYNPTNGPVVAPWLSWGPYLWTDGMRPRSDGLVWICSNVESDVQSDFTHPTDNGAFKVSSQLLAFFKTDPTATPWFLRKTQAPPTLTVSADPSNGVAPLTVNFTAIATSTNPPVRYNWTFDDGDSTNIQNAVKTFPTPDTYQVHVTVEDSAGNTATTTTVVTVSAPVFAITSINGTSNNVRISWPTLGGQTYVVQATDGSNGNYGTNFVDISPPIPAPAAATSHTNYIDVGGATNFPTRYYRLRLGP